MFRRCSSLLLWSAGGFASEWAAIGPVGSGSEDFGGFATDAAGVCRPTGRLEPSAVGEERAAEVGLIEAGTPDRLVHRAQFAQGDGRSDDLTASGYCRVELGRCGTLKPDEPLFSTGTRDEERQGILGVRGDRTLRSRDEGSGPSAVARR